MESFYVQYSLLCFESDPGGRSLGNGLERPLFAIVQCLFIHTMICHSTASASLLFHLQPLPAPSCNIAPALLSLFQSLPPRHCKVSQRCFQWTYHLRHCEFCSSFRLVVAKGPQGPQAGEDGLKQWREEDKRYMAGWDAEGIQRWMSGEGRDCKTVQ